MRKPSATKISFVEPMYAMGVRSLTGFTRSSSMAIGVSQAGSMRTGGYRSICCNTTAQERRDPVLCVRFARSPGPELAQSSTVEETRSTCRVAAPRRRVLSNALRNNRRPCAGADPGSQRVRPGGALSPKAKTRSTQKSNFGSPPAKPGVYQ